MENQLEITNIASFIEKETGISFPDTSLFQLKHRLEDFIKEEQVKSIPELLGKINSQQMTNVFKNKLLDKATNNETLFFRDPMFFKSIESFILTDLLLDFPSELLFWSAASSTGQEAISLAITLDEMSQKMPLPPYKIVATDICSKALDKARSGIYNDFEVSRGLSEERKLKYFSKVANGWQVKSNILSKIEFQYNNLIKPQLNKKFHLILCRNVLIYLKVDMKKEVVKYLSSCMYPNTGLILGVGETMLGINDNFNKTMIGNVIFYRK